MALLALVYCDAWDHTLEEAALGQGLAAHVDRAKALTVI